MLKAPGGDAAAVVSPADPNNFPLEKPRSNIFDAQTKIQFPKKMGKIQLH